MTLRHIPRAAFTARPWKNGAGTTHDIALLPEGSDHHDFDLRFALSPIPAPGPFSGFAGIDRVITLVRGADLALDFGDTRTTLSLGQSLPFNSALAPHGTPAPGGVEVINVMARRGVWRIVSCGVVNGQRHDIPSGAKLFVAATQGPFALTTPDQTLSLAPLDAALCDGPDTIRLSAPALVARLEPAAN